MVARKVTIALALALPLGLGPAAARANGRFPSAQQLVVSPDDPSRISAQVTYGFIHSHDGGESWSWTCEEAAGYAGEVDPPVALLAGGTLIAGLEDGLLTVSADACEYELAPLELATHRVVDVSRDPSEPAHAVALISDLLDTSVRDTRLFASDDGGATWSQLGAALPADFQGETLDRAASDPERVYVTGLRLSDDGSAKGQLAVSADGGASYSFYPVPFSEQGSAPFLGAVHPGDADTLWVRLAGNAGVLLRSTNGGVSFQKVFDGNGPLLAFALSPDGSQVVVGGEVDGLNLADATAAVFQRVSEVDARCATWTPEALFVCADQSTAGFAIGRSTDAGSTFTSLHRMGCLSGPVACGAGSATVDLCEPRWASQHQLLGDCEPEGSGGAGGGGAGAGPTGGGDAPSGGGCAASPAVNERAPAAPLVLALLLARALTLRPRARAGSATAPPNRSPRARRSG